MQSRQIDAKGDILEFWFSEPVRKKWFEPDREFDSELKERFGVLLDNAIDGQLETWRESADGALALVILLDQVTRNIYRGTPKAFSGDVQALQTARAVIEQGADKAMTETQRYMLYMPFQHAEDLETQEQGVALFGEIGLEKALDYMIRHRDIIARFGRFPHRNQILGRQSTDEELEFLKQPGSSF
ncbi:MAG: DUF924 domain-containing protein [Hyphomicrobiales bacterium]|nr:DUF924 domain-containing protein [Hyphomicrobiales bacterium]